MAGKELEAAPEDLEVVNGVVQVKGAPERSKTVGELAGAALGVHNVFLAGRGAYLKPAAEIDGGQAAVTIINALHTAAGLPAFSSTNEAEIQAQVIQERDRELFLEGHRMWSIRRHNLALNPATGTAYPIKGGTYGDTRCFPLPDIERNNNPALGGN